MHRIYAFLAYSEVVFKHEPLNGHRFEVFIYYFEATYKHVLTKLTYIDSKPFSSIS